jgi:hypothetical protein
MDGIQNLPTQVQMNSTQNSILIQPSEQNTTELDSQQKIETIRQRARIGGQPLTNHERAILMCDPIYQEEVTRKRTERLLAVYKQVHDQCYAEVQKMKDRCPGPESVFQTFKRMQVIDQIFIGSFVLASGYIYTKMLNEIVKKIVQPLKV